ncbi:MAG TPA: CHAP domain-containing protein [Candidatus Saccharimonadales bacterium]|jgi:surface antigen
MLEAEPHNKSFVDRLRSTPVLVSLSCLAILLTTLIGGFHVFAASCDSAADCQQQISNNASQLSSSQQVLSQLSSQAGTYEAAIGQLQSQISSLQDQIQTNETTQANLQTQISQNQAELTQQKSVLANDLQTLYVSGQLTPVEMLATSNSISDYVDQQVAYTAVQDKIESSVQQIAALEQKLQSQKTQVDQLVATEQTQDSQLSNAQSQQQGLLGYNQSQQASYNQQVANASSNISQLTAQLIALNDAGSTISGGQCGGGYPQQTPSSTAPGTYWGCNEPQDNTTDNWNMLNRECVSYTAYMVSTKYGVSTANWGNAYQWITSAEDAGYTVDQTPAPGAIAIRDRDYSEPGDVGHAMYVVSVNGSDSITVEEYNENYNGQFDERTFAPSSYDDRGGLYYIHFQ